MYSPNRCRSCSTSRLILRVRCCVSKLCEVQQGNKPLRDVQKCDVLRQRVKGMRWLFGEVSGVQRQRHLHKVRNRAVARRRNVHRFVPTSSLSPPECALSHCVECDPMSSGCLQCEEGFRVDTDGQCVACPDDCRFCDSTGCTECTDRHFVNDDKTCSGWFLFHSRPDCEVIDECVECSPTKKECTACKDGFFVNQNHACTCLCHQD